MTDKFECDEINDKLILMKKYFTNYINAVNSINLIFKTELNSSFNSALYNAQGDNIINLWDTYASKFSNYIYVFQKWLDEVSDIYKNNDSMNKIDLKLSPNKYNKTTIDKISKALAGDNNTKGSINKKGNESIKINNKFYNIIRDENNNIIKVIIDGKENIIHRSLFEENIKNNYNKYINKDMSEEEWNNYCSNLSEEERSYLSFLMT